MMHSLFWFCRLQKSFAAMMLTVCPMLTEEISKLILRTAQFQRTVLWK